MDSQVIKFKTHPGTFSKEELIVNLDALSKEKFTLVVGDILEISIPEKLDGSERADRSQLVLQVEKLPHDLLSKGVPLSINKELAHLFGFEGVREVRVRKLAREEVGLDLVELRFKDQCLTRSDMWRFSCSLIGKCVSVSKKLEFAEIRCQVSGLWTRGEKAQSGAIVDDTRVVFRSASAHFFIFIQISSEMWEFDQSGDLYFDKAEGGFLQELFQRWNAEQCTHEVTIIFFWRVYYTRDILATLPADATIRHNKRGNHFEDFYKVIVQGETMDDWTSRLVDVKKNFLHLRENLAAARGEDAIISSASEGNILEAINLAVNVYEKNFENCNFQLTGQQIVLVTPGVGVFEVERDLSMMTRERVIDSGVGIDLISLTRQPLHAVPLFKFHGLSHTDSQEYYDLPHWINYSFYNPVHPWNRFRFQPMLNLSDNLINSYLYGSKGECGSRRDSGTPYQPSKDVGGSPHSLLSFEPNRVLFGKSLSSHDEHDAAIFSCRDEGIVGRSGMMGRCFPKVHSVGMINAPHEELTLQQARLAQRKELASDLSLAPGVVFGIPSSPESDDLFLSDTLISPPPPTGSTGYTLVRGRDAGFVSSVQPTRIRRQSENHGFSNSITGTASSHTLCMATTSSAESLPKYSRLLAHSRGQRNLDVGNSGQAFFTHKKTKLINPFDPLKVHGELAAYHRRWVHAFPRDKYGLAFQDHHAIFLEGEDRATLSVSESTFSPTRKTSVDSFNVGSYTILDGKGSSLSDNQEFRNLSQDSRRSHFVSRSSSAGEMVLPTSTRSGSVGSREEQCSNNQSVYCRANATSSTRSPYPSSVHTQSAKWDDYGTGPETSYESAKVLHPMRPVWCKRRKKSGIIERRISDVSGRVVEDFTLVQRTGVDWKSLTEPASLPITNDFFPSESKLEQDYYQSPSELIVSSYDEYDATTGSRNPCPWIADHQKVDTFQAFTEMISQRLAQGFQLVFDSKDTTECHMTGGLRWSSGKSGSHQNSVFALHKALTEQKEMLLKKTSTKGKGKLHKLYQKIRVKLSLGKVFQVLCLIYPDIQTTIYKHKVQYHPEPFEYTYQLCEPLPLAIDHIQDHTPSKECSLFLARSAVYEYIRMEDYNWNFLDHHICGHSDFEVLQESLRYWRCRYLLLPSFPLPVQTSDGRQTDEERECAVVGENVLISNFIRFLEFLNHIKRAQSVPSTPRHHRSGSKHYKQTLATPMTQSMLHTVGIPGCSHFNSTPSSFFLDHNASEPLGPSTMSLQSPFATKLHRRHSDNLVTGDSLARSQSSASKYTSTPQHHSHHLHHHYHYQQHHDGTSSRTVSRCSSPSEERQQQQFLEAEKEKGDSCDPSPIPPPSSALSYRASPYMGLSGVGCPQLLRRKISWESMPVASPTHEVKDASRSGKREIVIGSSGQDSSSHIKGSSYQGMEVGFNKIKIGASPAPSKVDKSTEVVVDDASVSSGSFDMSIQLLTASSPIQIILRAMENIDHGLNFLAPHAGLTSSSCFVAMEAVSWFIENIGEVNTRCDAVKILQCMVQEQLILHASMDLSIQFLDGYLIYCIPCRVNQEALDTLKENSDPEKSFLFISPKYETFSKRWFEVVLQQPSASPSFSEMMGVDSSSASTSPYTTGYSLYATSSHLQPYYRDNHSRLSMRIPSAMVNRHVELNPDPQFKSNRPEWCFVRYDNTYNPHCGFQFEFQWMVTTIGLINQLMQNWNHKAAKCGFSLVPVPMLHSLYEDDGKGSPFSTRQYIPLLLPPFFPGTAFPIGEAMGKIMAAILQKLGFVLDPAIVNDDQQDVNLTLPIISRTFVHCSGSALVKPTCEDSLVQLMDRERRQRTNSQGSTLGRGNFANLNYIGEIMCEDNSRMGVAYTGGGVSDERSGWSLTKEGKLVASSTSLISDCFDASWKTHMPCFPLSKEGTAPSSCSPSLRCGFYWYQNTSLSRHRGMVSYMNAGGIISDQGNLQENMAALCSNQNDALAQLCQEVLNSDCSTDTNITL